MIYGALFSYTDVQACESKKVRLINFEILAADVRQISLNSDSSVHVIIRNICFVLNISGNDKLK